MNLTSLLYLWFLTIVGVVDGDLPSDVEATPASNSVVLDGKVYQDHTTKQAGSVNISNGF